MKYVAVCAVWLCVHYILLSIVRQSDRQMYRETDRQAKKNKDRKQSFLSLTGNFWRKFTSLRVYMFSNFPICF